ncbi:uncharacterized protein LOC144913920 isoform X6 [Branchiostoma floridae x Branchiostoma belcheri]
MEGSRKIVMVRIVKRVHQGGMQTRPVPTATPSNMQQAVLVTALSAAKHARIPDSAQAAGEELQHGAGDHDIEGDRTPPVGGVLGFSKETTFALLPRMHLEELQSELNRRNIEVKLAGGDRPRGRGDLEHVLREVMTREYEEAEGDESMDVSDTSSTFQHGRSNTSSTFEHGHSNTSSLLEHGSFLEEVSSSEVLSGLNNDQTTTPNIQGPTGKEETPSSRQAADKNVSETPSTDTFLGQVQVKKEPIEQYHVAMTSSSSHTVPPMTGPSTSQIGPTCTRSGMSQPNVTRAQNLAVKIKTEPGAEETTEEEQPESEDLSSEPCVSSPGQLSHELDMVDVSMGEEEEEDKLQSEEPVKEPGGDTVNLQADPRRYPTDQAVTVNYWCIDKTEEERGEQGRVEKGTTKNSTRWGIRLFKGWLNAEGLNTEFETLPPRELAFLLMKFYSEVRKDDGTRYSKASFACLRAAIHRHLTGPPHNHRYSILKDRVFQVANNIFVEQTSGMDSCKSYPPIQPSDIRKMFETKTLSVDDPVALQRLVYFYLGIYLCRCTRKTLRDFKISDFVAKMDDGRKYYTLKSYEDQTSVPSKVQLSPRLYASPGSTRPCPVQAFELYVSKLQPSRCGYLFQRPNLQWKPGVDSWWYFSEPVGHNKLGGMMRAISRAAGLSKIYTNHSVRLTAIKALDDAGFGVRVIMGMTGHAARPSVHRYLQQAATSADRQSQECSKALGAALDQMYDSEELSDSDLGQQ